MAEIIKMPKMSDTMTEGTIISWLKQVGEKVKSGEILAEVETDKATMELESYEDGFLLYIGAKEKEKVQVGKILAIVGEEGEDYSKLLDQDNDSETKEESTSILENKKHINDEEKIEPVDSQIDFENKYQNIDNKNKVDSQSQYKEDESRIKASPLAKKIAQEKNIDLINIVGTGPGGRIIKKDINQSNINTIPNEEELTDFKESFKDISISPIRQVIAQKLTQSLAEAPHFYLTIEVNMDRVVEIRSKLEQSGIKISFNDIITKATAESLSNFPKINSYWLEDRIRYNQHVHIGIAVATEDGLYVPVLKFANKRSLTNISCKIKYLVERVKKNLISNDEMKNHTFTISNLGMYGIDNFTSIINPPSSAILAIGTINKKPICNKSDQIVISNMMKITLSCDHRVIDGAIGAQFLQTLKNNLEEPLIILT